MILLDNYTVQNIYRLTIQIGSQSVIDDIRGTYPSESPAHAQNDSSFTDSDLSAAQRKRSEVNLE